MTTAATNPSAIVVDLEVTGVYSMTITTAEILDELRHHDPAEADQLSQVNVSGIAAWLHRTRLDDPEHPVIQMIWGRMESDGEVSDEDWSFTPETTDTQD